MFENQNIRVRYLRILEKIRSFLLSTKSREFLIFLFFVFVSFTFWLLQVLNDDFETELSIPLRMKNVPENVVLTTELPKELKVGVKDRGTVLVNYLFDQTLYPVTIDFEEYLDKGSQVRILAKSLEKRITSQLNQSTKLSSIKPDTLEYIYARGEAKKVPVKMLGEVKSASQYYISDIVYSPDSVMVYAPSEILDTLACAYTQPLYVDELEDTTRRQIDLMPIKGARFTPASSEVSFYVDMYSEKVLEVPVYGVNFPDDKILRTFPSKVRVFFQIGLARYMDVREEDLMVAVDYNVLMEKQEEKCTPVLIQSPEYIKHARISPEKIDYLIEQKVIFND